MLLTDNQINENWEKLLEHFSYDNEVIQLLKYFEKDTTDLNSVLVLGFKNAPAAKGFHHAYSGGLVEHILEMLDFLEFYSEKLDLDYNLLKAGALFHDFHKGFKHYCIDSDCKIAYYQHYFNTSMTDNQKTIAMLSGAITLYDEKISSSAVIRPLSVEELNIINCSEGGWAKNPPKEASVYAKLVYLADEMSVIQNRVANGLHLSNRERDMAFYQS